MKVAQDTRALFEKLNSGSVFYHPNFKSEEIGYFSRVLSSDSKYIYWEHYGASAERNQISGLVWLLKVIFQMSAAEFMAYYVEQ